MLDPGHFEMLCHPSLSCCTLALDSFKTFWRGRKVSKPHAHVVQCNTLLFHSTSKKKNQVYGIVYLAGITGLPPECKLSS